MGQLIKNILKVILYISLFLVIGSVIINYVFNDRIQIKVSEKINNQITSEISIDDIELSLFNYFPNASVNLSNVIVKETKGFSNDTLIFAKNIYIKLSIYDILFNKVEIDEITLSECDINIKYNKAGKPNFKIFKNNNQNNFLSIEKVVIIKSKFRYLTKSINIDWDLKKSILNLSKNECVLSSQIYSNHLIVSNKNYIKNKNIVINAPISYNENKITINETSEINIEGLLIKSNGKIINNTDINILFSCVNQEISDVIINTPEHLKFIYENYSITGLLSCDGSIKGNISDIKNPSLNITYNINNGLFKLKQSKFNLKDITLSGYLNNGVDNNFVTTEINANKFIAKTKKGFINGKFSLKNLKNYYLNTSFSSKWSAEEINDYFDKSKQINMAGEIIAETKYSGKISFNNDMPKLFLNGNHESLIKLNDINFNYNYLDYNFKELECSVKNNNILFNSGHITIADSDFMFTGEVTNLLDHLMYKNDSIIITGLLTSTYIKLDELIKLNNSTQQKKSNNIFDWIDINITTDIKNLSYNQFVASDITGKLNFKNFTLNGKNIAFKSLNGDVISDFKFYKSNNNNYKLFSQTDLKKLNIRNTFLTFNNFNQNFITSKHIKGQGSAEIQMQASWDADFNFKSEDLNLKSHLVIEKGELLKFKPLENLSNFVSVDDLKEVKFSKLENTIEIDNSIIKIPNMEINSTALSVILSGTHTFAQKIDYRIKLLLSELISAKFRKKNTQIKESEFGEIKKESKIFNTIYFKMTGDANNPNIAFDGLRIKEDIKKGIKKEKELITNIIKEDVLKSKDKLKIEKGEDIIIEWDDKK